MRKIFYGFTLFFVAFEMTVASAAEKIEWLTNFQEAKAKAVAEKKDIFLEFTGSDWCHWCIVMKKEILDKEEFVLAAKDKFVFVEIDFPEKKKLDPEIKKQNDLLEKEYQVDGYPTMIHCDATGKPYATSGYDEGDTVEKYLKLLGEMTDVKKQRDEAFSSVEKAKSNEERADFMLAGLMAMDDFIVETYYAAELEKLASWNQQRANEYVSARKDAMAKKIAGKLAEEEEERLHKLSEPFLQKVEPLIQAKKFDDAVAEWKTFNEASKEIPDQMKKFFLLDIQIRQAIANSDAEMIRSLCDTYASSYPDSFLAKNLEAVKASYIKELQKKNSK